MKISELAEEFYDLHVLAENAESQQISVRQILDNWILPQLGDKDPNALTAMDVTRFRAHMLKAELEPRTINLRLKTLRKMLNWGKTHDLCGAPPKITLLKEPEIDVAFFSDDQINAILGAARTHPWYGMVRVALCSGLRIGELRALTWSDVDFVTKTLRIKKATWSQSHKVKKPKSGKSRTVALNNETLRVLAALHDARRATDVHVFTITGQMLAYNTCRKALGVILRAADIKGKYGWHSFRHTFGSHIAMAGESLVTLQKLMGHASINTTMRYVHLSPDAGHKVVSALDKFKKS